eukprot:403358691
MIGTDDLPQTQNDALSDRKSFNQFDTDRVSYVGRFDMDKYIQQKESQKMYIDHFRNESQSPRVVQMTGVAANKLQKEQKKYESHNHRRHSKHRKRTSQQSKTPNNQQKDQSNTNKNLIKKKGFQKIPTSLIQQNSRQKRHAFFFKKILKDSNNSNSSSILDKLKFQSNLLLKKSTQAKPQNFLQRLSTRVMLSGNAKKSPAKSPYERKSSTIRIDKLDMNEASEEEEDDMLSINEKMNIDKSRHVFYPESFFKSMWDIISFGLVLYQSLILPFKISFTMTVPLWVIYFDVFQDCFFMLDVLVNLNTGFYFKGILTMQRQDIIRTYLRSWFFIDSIASFPYTWAIAFAMGVSFEDLENDNLSISSPVYKTPRLLKLFKIARMLRMLKLLRVFKFQKFMMKIEEHIVTDFMNLLITFFFIGLQILFISHWLACFFWNVGVQAMDDYEDCWIRKSQLQDASLIEQYISSLYWAFTTMVTVGYGDITPRTTIERVYTMLAMIIASGMFSFTINSIGTIVTRYNILAANYREKMNYVNKFLLTQQIPNELRLKIRRYLEYIWESKKEIKIDEKEVMAMLNESLREKITVYLNGRILKEMKFFEAFGLEVLSELTFYFQRQSFALDDHVFQEGDESLYLFSIVQGKVGMIHKRTHTYLTELSVGDCFGEIGFFTDDPRMLTAKSRDYTQLYVIEKKDFMHIAENYITAIQSYHQIRSAMKEEANYLVLNIKCYICDKKGHVALGCQYLPTKKGNIMKHYRKYRKTEYLEDSSAMKDMKSLSISYIYEEDDPKKVPNRKLGEMQIEKQVFASRENTIDIKNKNKLLRDIYLKKKQDKDKNHKIIELIFNEDVKEKEIKKFRIMKKKLSLDTRYSNLNRGESFASAVKSNMKLKLNSFLIEDEDNDEFENQSVMQFLSSAQSNSQQDIEEDEEGENRSSIQNTDTLDEFQSTKELTLRLQNTSPNKKSPNSAKLKQPNKFFSSNHILTQIKEEDDIEHHETISQQNDTIKNIKQQNTKSKFSTKQIKVFKQLSPQKTPPVKSNLLLPQKYNTNKLNLYQQMIAKEIIQEEDEYEQQTLNELVKSSSQILVKPQTLIERRQNKYLYSVQQLEQEDSGQNQTLNDQQIIIEDIEKSNNAQNYNQNMFILGNQKRKSSFNNTQESANFGNRKESLNFQNQSIQEEEIKFDDIMQNNLELLHNQEQIQKRKVSGKNNIQGVSAITFNCYDQNASQKSLNIIDEGNYENENSFENNNANIKLVKNTQNNQLQKDDEEEKQSNSTSILSPDLKTISTISQQNQQVQHQHTNIWNSTYDNKFNKQLIEFQGDQDRPKSMIIGFRSINTTLHNRPNTTSNSRSTADASLKVQTIKAPEQSVSPASGQVYKSNSLQSRQNTSNSQRSLHSQENQNDSQVNATSQQQPQNNLAQSNSQSQGFNAQRSREFSNIDISEELDGQEELKTYEIGSIQNQIQDQFSNSIKSNNFEQQTSIKQDQQNQLQRVPDDQQPNDKTVQIQNNNNRINLNSYNNRNNLMMSHISISDEINSFIDDLDLSNQFDNL